MAEIRSAYLTGSGAYLPGPPLDNDEMARRLGGGTDTAGATGAALRRRVLAANGIRTRHYALDGRGAGTMLNEELAATAIEHALKDRDCPLETVGLLAAGTTQGDLLVPGFASMVHGRLGGVPMEVLSAGGVCASGMAALAAATRAVRLGDHDTAVVSGSELVSRSLRQHRDSGVRPGFDTEFLRWTLSDGAGAVVVQPAPRPGRTSLRVDWIHLTSHAHRYPVCMSAGLEVTGAGPAAGRTWQDRPDLATAERDGLVRLRQDVSALPALFRLGLAEFTALVRAGRLSPGGIDHVLCHYSAQRFRGTIMGLLRGADLMIDERRWFSNLDRCGNTGAASIFVMLDEAWHAGRFSPGERILLIVPESGRFSVAFAQLTCVGPDSPATPAAAGRATTATAAIVAASTVDGVVASPSPLGRPLAADGAVTRTAVLELARVWADFEARVRETPLVRRIDAGTATMADYRALLVHLRAQVVDGGRWIARAASNFGAGHFALRSAAIGHAAAEHRDFLLLEEDFVALGGSLAEIRAGRPNLGTEALSAYLFHRASQPDPVDLLGAMFLIEGLGTALAGGWATSLTAQLGLREDQVRFLRYHAQADDGHVGLLSELVRASVVDREQAQRVVRTAEVVARLYAWQLAEVTAP